MVDIYREPKTHLQNYQWYAQYKEPDDNLKLHETYFDKFWYFLHERMSIYEKRVLLKQPAPWTDDPILQYYRFTNVVRDMDKLSIYVRNHILCKIDEPVDDVELRKKSVLLNIMTFRIWTKIDTYNVIGFLDLADPDMLKKWEVSKQKLLQRREDGIANFTGVFFINHLHSKECASTNNKTFNAIAMIDYWIRNIDTIYDTATIKCKSLVEQVAYFQSLPSIGWFNAYEFACDVAMVTRYCTNHLVEWTQDNGTNVGPGAERGINFIFINKGGMSDYECILYLRSIWKHEMQSRGYYDDFVRCLPKELHGDIDLRVIEHCLCETHKYIKALEGTGRPKIVFKPSTTDLDSLKC